MKPDWTLQAKVKYRVEKILFVLRRYIEKNCTNALLLFFFQRKISFADPDWIGRYSDFNISRIGKDSQLINQI